MYILDHGFNICKINKIKPYFVAEQLRDRMIGKDNDVYLKSKNCWFPPEDKVPWDKWCMIIDGKKYYSKFKNMDEWIEFYNPERKRRKDIFDDYRFSDPMYIDEIEDYDFAFN